MYTQRAGEIITRISAINRRSIYSRMTPAMERAIARLWRAFNREVVGA